MIRLAGAPVSWGIFEFAGLEPPYPYARVLDEIAQTGYRGLELGPYGYLPTDPERLREELESRNLQLLSAFVPVELVNPFAHAQGERAALQVGGLLAALGAEYLVLADDNGKVGELIERSGQRRGSWLSDSQWDTVASAVNRIASRVRSELGLQVVFHHHCAGCVETPEETRALLSRTEVGLCLDTGHWLYGGGDVLACIREYQDRVRYLHLKDCRPQGPQDYFQAVRSGVFCPLGQGQVDFPGLFRELEAVGYSGWAVVEQDLIQADPDAPRRYSQANRDYLRGLGL